MRVYVLLPMILASSLAINAPGHSGMPPGLPDVYFVAPATISSSATSCDVVGTSWCSFSVGNLLKCKKNGTYVSLSFNSTTTNWPHSYHLDKTFNVNLTPLGLVAGDVLVWEYITWATSGPNSGQRVASYATTTVN